MTKIIIFLFFLLLNQKQSCPITYKPQIIHESLNTSRSLQNSSNTLEPLRIAFDFSNVANMASEKLAYLRKLLNEIGLYLSSHIKVPPFNICILLLY